MRGRRDDLRSRGQQTLLDRFLDRLLQRDSGARVPDHVGGAGVAGEAGGPQLAERISGQRLGEVAERFSRHDLGFRGQVPQPERVAIAGQGVP